MKHPALPRAALLLAALSATAGAASVDDQVRAAIDGSRDTPFLAQELARLAGDDPARTAAVLQAIGRSGEDAAAAFVVERIASPQPRVAAAAIAALGTLWPTRVEDAEAVRAAIARREAEVAQAAIAFVRAAADDGALRELAARLAERPGPVRDAARAALVELTRHDAGDDGAAWTAWAAQRDDALADVLARARAAVAGSDPTATMAALQGLLALRGPRGPIGEILVEAAEHRDPAVASLARSGLLNLGGPVAACAAARLQVAAPPERPRATPPPQVATIAPPPPRPWMTTSGVAVVVAIATALGGLAGWAVRGERRRQAAEAARRKAADAVDEPKKPTRRPSKVTFVS